MGGREETKGPGGDVRKKVSFSLGITIKPLLVLVFRAFVDY